MPVLLKNPDPHRTRQPAMVSVPRAIDLFDGVPESLGDIDDEALIELETADVMTSVVGDLVTISGTDVDG
ncbi:MAG: hypothetical protein AAFO62_09150, partial [Pseudomonadota bacterium]